VVGRRSIALASPILVAAVIVGVQASPGRPASESSARAFEYGVQIQVPTRDTVIVGQHASPAWGQSADGSFAYPGDGSVVQASTVNGRLSESSGGATVRAGADVTGLSLFGGEITADAVVARATAAVENGQGSAAYPFASVQNLIVLGQAVAASPDLRVQLGDWGHAYLLQQEQLEVKNAAAPGFHAWMVGIDIRLDADHDGLPIGTRILVGYADALASGPPPAPAKPPPVTQAGPTSPTPTTPAPTTPAPTTSAPTTSAPTTSTTTPNAPKKPSNSLNDLGLFPVLTLPPPLQATITSRGYVFPVYGPSGYGDTFGAPRGDVPGGWHHGDDIFAPLGAPVLAVADGTVFSVGPNRIGGNRLWLQDLAGNQFYYAHLSAYTPLAHNGTHVKAGDVLGFVGNTGDAAGGPYHLHFEVHPASLLFLGYDGAVDPTPYLDAWRHLRDVSFPGGVAWAPQSLRSLVPPPGAMLLQSTDISTASGLDPSTLRQALVPKRSDALLTLGQDKGPERPSALLSR
jgi:murein DD-endopeptidase MepM/ murein hydrolase activator NlpD